MGRFLAVVVLSPLWCFYAHTTEANEGQENGKLEMVTVTGQVESQETIVSQLPPSTSIVDYTQLQSLKIQQPAELLQRISGVSMARNIRIPISSKSYTVVTVDGLTLGSPYSSSASDIHDINPRNIQRLEVIKGLGSALYSSNAFGGTLNVVTRSPAKEHEKYLDIEVGNYNRSRLGFQASGQSESVEYFFDASRQRMHGYRDGYRDESDQLSGKGRIQLSKHNRLALGLGLINRYERFPGELTEAEYLDDPQQTGSALGSDEHLKIRMATFSDIHEFSQKDKLQFSSVYNHEKATGINYRTGPTNSDRTDSETKVVYRHQFDALQGEFISGASYIHGRSDFTRYRRGVDGQVVWNSPISDSISHTNLEAAFAEYSFFPTPPLEIRIGARREKVILDSRRKSSDRKVSARFSSTDPRIGLEWSLDKNTSIWASYNEGFYTPNTRELYTDDNANPHLQPEQISSYELGLRGHRHSKLQYSFTYYESDIENFIVIENFISDQGESNRRFSNAGLVKTSGLEFDLGYDLNSWLSTAVAYTYNNNYYGEYINPYTRQDLSGNTLSRSPDHHLNLRVTVTPINGLRLELEWDKVSSYYTNDDSTADPNGKFSRDGIANLRASYDVGKTKLWMHCLNLTNTQEDDVTYSPAGRNGTVRLPGGRNYEITNGAAVYVGASFKF